MPGPPRRLTRLPESQSTDPAELHRLLDDTYLAHIAFTAQDEVTVVPTVATRYREQLVWHGSTGSGWMRVLSAGEPVAVSLTVVEALVVARADFENSFWYRSAVVRGRPRRLTGEEHAAALDALTDRVLPGRSAETRPATRRELAAAMVLGIPLDDWTLKVSRAWPEDAPEDVATDTWAGVVPFEIRSGPARPAPDLRPGIPVPESCRSLERGPGPLR